MLSLTILHRAAVFVLSVIQVSVLFSQNRTFQRPAELSRSVILDQGMGRTLIAAQENFNLDSTQIHLLSADADQVITTYGGFRLMWPFAQLNDAAAMPDGAILAGAHVGLVSGPFVMRMDTLGNVIWCISFVENEWGLDQVSDLVVDGEFMELFMWNNAGDNSSLRISGRVDGTIQSVLRLGGQQDVEHAVNIAIPSGNYREQLVIHSATIGSTERLYVMKVDSVGLTMTATHDHSSGAMIELEEATGLIQTTAGDYVYTLLYTLTNGVPLVGRMVRMDTNGTILWANDYFKGADQLRVYEPIETSDGGFMFTAQNMPGTEHFLIKADGQGDVVWAKQYVQSQTSLSPLGQLFKNDQGRIYSYTNNYITELDEDGNACDLQAVLGVVALAVTPVETPLILLELETMIPSFNMTTEPRIASYMNQELCVATGVQEVSALPRILLFPDPASDWVTMELPEMSNSPVITVCDLQGRQVHVGMQRNNDGYVLDISGLAIGTYVIHVRQGEQIMRSKFVKV